MFAQFSLAQSSKTYLVVFNDKTNSTFSIEKPKEFLSEKSIARRQKQGIVINSRDLPVNASYINDVKNIGVSVLNQSKWMNAVTVSTNDETKLKSIKKLIIIILKKKFI